MDAQSGPADGAASAPDTPAVMWHVVQARPGTLVYAVPRAKAVSPLHVGWQPESDSADAGHDEADDDSVLHYARYIGRVGVLAAALGVGAAVAGNAVAQAAPGDDDSTHSSTESTEPGRPTHAPTRRRPSVAGPNRTQPPPPTVGPRPTRGAPAASVPAVPRLPTPPQRTRISDAPDIVPPLPPRESVPDQPSEPPPAPVPAPPTVATTSQSPEPAPVTPSPAPGDGPTPVTGPQPGAPDASAAEDVPADAGPPAAERPAERQADPVVTGLRGVPAPPRSPVTPPAAVAAQNPLGWGLLAWVRRAARNPAPALTYDTGQTTQLGDTVTGRLGDGTTAGDFVYSATAPVNGGSVSIDDSGRFTYTAPDELAETGGTDSFTVTVTDAGNAARIRPALSTPGVGRVASATISLSFDAFNRAPVAGTPDFTLGPVEHSTGAVPGQLHVSDPDHDALSYTVLGGPTQGVVDLNSATGAFTYTPTPADRHEASAEQAPPADLSDDFSVTVDDGRGGVVTVPVTVGIDPANNAPTMTITDTSHPDAVGTVVVTVATVDTEDDPITYLVVNNPTYGIVSYDPEVGEFTYAPTTQDVRSQRGQAVGDRDEFTIQASDAHRGLATARVIVDRTAGSVEFARLDAEAHTDAEIGTGAVRADRAHRGGNPSTATEAVVRQTSRRAPGTRAAADTGPQAPLPECPESGECPHDCPICSCPTTVLTIEPLDYNLLGNTMVLGFGGAVCANRTVVQVHYPASLASDSIDRGVAALDEALHSTEGKVVVFAHSQGAQVVSRWLREHASDPDAPDPARVSFLLIGNPLRKYGGAGVGADELDGRVGLATPNDTQYHVTDVALQYDGWADKPTRREFWATWNNLQDRWGINFGSGIHTFGYRTADFFDPGRKVYTEGTTDYVLLPHKPLLWVSQSRIEKAYSRPEV